MKKTLGLLSFLTLFGCGDVDIETYEAPLPPPEPIATPAPDADYPDLTQNKLLTDEEMHTPALPQEPSPNANYVEWVQENHHKIRSLTYDEDFSDLSFLADQVDGKRIVQLGESSHGSREFNQAKVRIIKYLHQELGYNVLAFESSLTGCHIINRDIATQTATTTMKGCIYSIWHTSALLDLFEYIVASQGTDTPLKLAGFDNQFSGSRDTQAHYMAFFHTVVSSLDSGYWPQAELFIHEFFESWSNGTNCSISGNACEQFHDNLNSTLAGLETFTLYLRSYLEDTTAPIQTQSEQDLRFAVLSTYSMQAFLRQIAASSDIDGVNIRDLAMSDNLTALAETTFPSEKLIVWAHNAHIRTDDQGETITWMGEHMKPHWQEELYTVGFYMLRGQHAWNNRSVGDVVTTHDDNSLEAVSYSLRTAAAFIPFTSTDDSAVGDDWLHQRFKVKTWGRDEHFLILSESYDGVIVIDRSQVPEYIE